MIAFEAYAGDCRLVGRLESGVGRLTDLLNDSSELVISEARLESLADGRVVVHQELEVHLAELYAVVAAGFRGDPVRRIRTRTVEVVVDLGPYEVTGVLHGLPASNPLVMVVRRPPWVPLTRASITYRRGAELVTAEAPTLIVNRSLARSLHALDEESERIPLDSLPPIPRFIRQPRPTGDVEDVDADDEA